MPQPHLGASRARHRLAAVAVLALAAGGCKSAAQQREDADRQAYEILERRRLELALGESDFTIEPPMDSLRQRLLRGEDVGRVGIVRVLDLAAENSRDYQRRKEDLYLAALDLTLERLRFALQYDGTLGALVNGDGEGAANVDLSAGAAFSRLLGTGASIIADMGLSMSRSVSTGDSWKLVGAPFLSLSQPLMRGFGERIVREPLTQGERNVVYELREFERFRRTFAVNVTNLYFSLLRTADQVRNEKLNMDNLTVLRERNEALANAGRLSDIQADQARQDELRSQNRLISAQERYGTALDDFKLFLGLPAEVEFEIEQDELYALAIDESLTIGEREAIPCALRQRLDYMTVLDQLVDSERKLNIAADALRTRITITGTGSANSTPNQPLEYAKDDLSWTLRADIDLPLQLIAERNAYRGAIINVERARRSAEEAADRITADLRASLRQALTRRQSVEIQAGAVVLNERRIESATLNLQAGRASTRDILEAQQALVDARNALTSARVDYYLSQLALWRDMELLRVEEQGLRFAREGLALAPSTAPATSAPNHASAGDSGAQETR
ncbi:MAG: TolC family protein [Planctomycetes bacterium]|nr:TolC family protein [Planctomycetota bacterium]